MEHNRLESLVSLGDYPTLTIQSCHFLDIKRDRLWMKLELIIVGDKWSIVESKSSF